MNFQLIQVHILVLLLGILAPQHSHQAQTKGEVAYHTQRKQAVELFDQGKRLEALPLLEELAQKNPKDEEVVVDLAASLIHHAATLTDQRAAASERLRAKSLLEKSGSTTTLAENLLQLLRAMPQSGDIQFSKNPAVEQAMLAGEAAFTQRNFDEAIKNYSRALEQEPGNYTAALFIGNTYYKKDDFARAGKWYEKAIQLDPNIETAYRYYAEMLVRAGEMAKSRSMLIHAAVAEPYNRIVWRDLRTWADINHSELNFVSAGVLSVPKDPKQDELALDVKIFPERPKSIADAWQAYQSVHADWKEHGKFKRHFPQESEYRHSLAEETEALTAEAKALQTLRGDIGTAELVTDDPSLVLLLKLYQAGVLEPYVLFRLGDEGIARDYDSYRAKNRDKLEEYMDKFVVPPALPSADTGTAQSAASPK
jgi:tetratricopeptide (TPR) repeat protein